MESHKKLIKEIEMQWKINKWPVIGFCLLVWWWWNILHQCGAEAADNERARYFGFALGIAAGVIEVVLMYRKETVITHFFDPLFKPAVDLIILAVMFALTVLLIDRLWVTPPHNHTTYQLLVMGILFGHFFTRGE